MQLDRINSPDCAPALRPEARGRHRYGEEATRTASKAITTLGTLGREPLVQFVLIGALLLCAQKLLAPARAEAPPLDRITLSQRNVAAITDAFRQANGRAPSTAELRGAIEQRIDEEVLYREALRLGLDREDVIVRREMMRKMRFLIEDVAALPEPSPAQLQAWLDEHPERFALPDRVSFEQVFLGRARHGDELQFDAGRSLAQLRARPDAFRSLSDPFPAGLVVDDADRLQLERHFGGEFATAVLQLAPGEWSEPLRSPLGLHLVRITERKAGRSVTVAEAGKALLVDVRVAQREQANRQAVERLRARYAIELEAGAGAGAAL